MVEEGMTPDDVAKRALELAARAEELARHAHETAGIDEQLAKLEAELAALDAEEAGVGGDAVGADGDEADHAAKRAVRDAAPGWADRLTENMGGLGDRLGALIEQVVETATQSVETLGDDAGAAVENHSVRVAAPGLVRIDSDGGSVRVHGHAEPEVSVRARGRQAADQARFVEVVERDGVVEITCRNRSLWRRRGVRLDVTVPIGSDLDVTTGGGTVTVDGAAGAAEIKTGGGGIRLHGARRNARLTTGGGSIDATDFDGTISAGTGGGSIRIDGRLHGQSVARTGGGSISVRLADDVRISVDAHGTAAFTDVEGLRAARGLIFGRIGDGGDGELRATTGGGAVRIVR